MRGRGRGPRTLPQGGSLRDGAPFMGAVTTHLPWGEGGCVVVCSCNFLRIAIAHCDGRHRCHSRGNGDGSHLQVLCICKRLLGLRLQNRCSVAKPDPATPHGQSSWGAAEGEGRFPTANTTLQSFPKWRTSIFKATPGNWQQATCNRQQRIDNKQQATGKSQCKARPRSPQGECFAHLPASCREAAGCCGRFASLRAKFVFLKF